MTPLDCRQAVRKLHTFLDRELSEEEIREVQYHLDGCPPCQNKFRFEASIKRLVGTRTRSEQAPFALRSRIATILGQAE